MTDGPSDHLSWEELQCKDGTPYPRAFVDDGRLFKLTLAFEGIRSIFGNKPIVVLSAYRTPEWNKKVGGAPSSQHVQGRALDLRPPKGVTVESFYKVILNNAHEFGINGIGRYKNFVHIDIRPGDHRAVWRGFGVKDSVT